ncbi:hypothetical protein BHE74_00055621, partial [Ensete ventricosum]
CLQTSGVRSMTFNPDGRTLLCGLHESLKVNSIIFSWEPIRCHDAVDVGWSRLSDMNIHEGKLLGCSYNQSCVGVWVVDLSSTGVGRTVPYDIQSKFANFQKVSNIRENSDKSDMSVQSVGIEHNEFLEQTAISSCNAVTQPVITGENNLNDIKRVRTRRLGANLFRESSANYDQENCKSLLLYVVRTLNP